MKKILITLAAVLCCTGMMTVFTGCNNNPVTPPSPQTKEATDVVMAYAFTIDTVLQNRFNFTVEYYDNDGQIKMEAMNGLTWKKSVKAPLPATLGARLKIQLKEGLDPATMPKFKFTYSYTFTYQTKDKDGKDVSNLVSVNDIITRSPKEGMVQQWLDELDGVLDQRCYDFDAKGNASLREW